MLVARAGYPARRPARDQCAAWRVLGSRRFVLLLQFSNTIIIFAIIANAITIITNSNKTMSNRNHSNNNNNDITIENATSTHNITGAQGILITIILGILINLDSK